MKNINEQVSRIKGMMGLSEGEVYKSSAEEHQEYLESLKTVDGTVEYLTKMSREVEGIASRLRDIYEGTEFWRHIKPLYSGLRSVSDMEVSHTRSDQRDENVTYAIEFIRSDAEQSNYDEPTDDETMNGYNREGGINYGGGENWQGR